MTFFFNIHLSRIVNLLRERAAGKVLRCLLWWWHNLDFRLLLLRLATHFSFSLIVSSRID
jgi:hypothetical protein